MHDQEESDKELFKQSFTVCYLVMFGTAAITFIEALRTSNEHARHILNLETAVSLTAGFVYGMFLTMAEHDDFDLKKVVFYRYIDWCITTPMLLLVLVLFFTFHSKSHIGLHWLALVVALNYAMLLFGYMGEQGTMEKRKSQIFGFSAFFLMLVVIYTVFIHHKTGSSFSSLILFFIFSVVWGMYGVAAEMDDRTKNLMYNGLDVIAKVLFGLGLWMYYGHVTTL